jgi:hypothetical protein
LIFQGYGTWEGLGDVEIDTDASIRGIPSMLGIL